MSDNFENQDRATLFGLQKKTIDQINSVFKRYPQIKSAIIYGSRAKGNYKNGSDIDLVLKGDDLTLEIMLKAENELDDLLLPYKIDLSIVKHIQDEDLLDHIERVGKIFYSLTP